MGKRILLRYCLAVLLGGVCVAAFIVLSQYPFDAVAGTTLFAFMISVGNEDESLGPVIHKTLNRFCGACLGGICGYCFILLVLLFPSAFPYVSVIVFPLIFVTLVQAVAESTYVSNNYIEKYKLKHFVIQVQVGFGLVYMGHVLSGSSARRSDTFKVAVIRTCAQMAGVLCLLIASLLAYPETSTEATARCLSETLNVVGDLTQTMVKTRVEGHTLARYNHHQVLLGAPPDAQISAFLSIEKKLKRATSLLPFLYLEPAWVPGLPPALLLSGWALQKHWAPFLGVLASRVGRLRGSLSALDNNMRIASELADKLIKQHIAENMEALALSVRLALALAASFVLSPFRPRPTSPSSQGKGRPFWMGDVNMKQQLRDACATVQARIESFAVSFEEGLHEDNSICRKRAAELEHIESHSSGAERPLSHRARLGHTLDFYFKTGPIRTFCNLCIQVSIQTTSMLLEVVDFIESMESEADLALHHRDVQRVTINKIPVLPLADEENQVGKDTNSHVTSVHMSDEQSLY